MGAYILRRLLLIIPTLFGIMVINFALVQFVPGGPVEQVIAQMQGDGDVFERLCRRGRGCDAWQEGDNEGYMGARGLPPEFIEELKAQYGLDKPPLERFVNMMWNYMRFDFGESYFRSIGVTDLVLEKMPVSITLGLWSTLIAYLISIPLGIRKAVHDGSTFDSWTSGIIIAAYAIPGFLFAIMLVVLFAGGSYWQIFPLRGLTSDNFDQLSALGQGQGLPLAYHAAGSGLDHRGVCDADAADQEQLSGRDQEALCDDRPRQGAEREPRAVWPCVPQRDADRDRRVSGGVHRGVLWRRLLIETIFSLDGLGRLGFEAAVSRDYPVMFGTLFLFGLIGLVVNILSDLMYVLVDPRIDFEKREG